MKKIIKTRKITDGVEILEHLFLRNDPEMRKRVDKELEKLQIGQQIYDLRTEANLTQEDLAKKIGTTGSVISRLESAEYAGHSLKMLNRIAKALGKQLDVRIIDGVDRPKAV